MENRNCYKIILNEENYIKAKQYYGEQFTRNNNDPYEAFFVVGNSIYALANDFNSLEQNFIETNFDLSDYEIITEEQYFFAARIADEINHPTMFNIKKFKQEKDNQEIYPQYYS